MLTPQPGQVERNPFDELVLGGGTGTETVTAGVEEAVEEDEEEEEEEEEAEQEKSEGTSNDEHFHGNDASRPQGARRRSGLAGRDAEGVNETETVRRNGKLPWRERLRHFTWTWVSRRGDEREEGRGRERL